MGFKEMALQVASGQYSPDDLAGVTDVAWTVPSLNEEISELERTSEEMMLPLDLLTEAFQSASLEVLEDSDWTAMINSDSAEPLTLDEAYEAAGVYGRNLDRILSGMLEGSSMPAAIVLILPDDTPYGVAGNTRLMAARALGLRPKVMMLRPDYSGLDVAEWQEAAAAELATLTGPWD
jgi:hypothetical protein